MPKKLMDCIARVRKSGKSESEAWAICVSSTGLHKEKHKKKSELINHLISLANKLDEKGCHEEVVVLDEILRQQVKMAAWEEEDPANFERGEEWKTSAPEVYSKYELRDEDWFKVLARALELTKEGGSFNAALTQACKEFGKKPFGSFAPTKGEAENVVKNIVKRHPEVRDLLVSVGLQNLLPSGVEQKSKPEAITHEQISEPMPGEVPSAEELEKWLKSSKLHSHLITLANKLDELNLSEEATILDTTLEKEAQWQWMKEKGQQMKDWYQGEKNPNIDIRTALTKMRQNHWNLVKKLNTAYQLLVKSHKNIGKPEYLRDITSMIENILKDTQKASADLQAIATKPAPQQQQQQPPPQGPATPQPPTTPAVGAAPAAQAVPVAPGASITPGASLIERLTKLADKLESNGDKEAAKVVRAQWQAATEMGQKGMDWMLGRGKGERAQTDKQWSNFHWRVASVFKSAYDKLNATRQYLNDPSVYPERFQAVVNEIQTDLNTVLGEIQNAGKPAPVAAQPAAQPAVQPVQPAAQPIPSTILDARGNPIMKEAPPADQIKTLLEGLTPEQQAKAVELLKQLRGQTS